MRAGPACAVTLGALLASSSARAYECKRSDRYAFVHLAWPARRVPFGLDAAAPEHAAVVRAAFSAWTEAPCTDLALDYVGLVGLEDAVSQVRFVDAGWTEGGRDPMAVAVTVSRFVRGTGALRRADVEVNRELFALGDAARGCVPGQETFDLLAVLTHEAGHFIGLDHTTLYAGRPGDPTMAPTVGACETDKRSLEEDDVAGLCALYPAGQVAQPCAPLPPREGPYVASEALGCAAAGPGAAAPWAGLLAVLSLARRRRRSCRNARSGG